MRYSCCLHYFRAVKRSSQQQTTAATSASLPRSPRWDRALHQARQVAASPCVCSQDQSHSRSRRGPACALSAAAAPSPARASAAPAGARLAGSAAALGMAAAASAGAGALLRRWTTRLRGRGRSCGGHIFSRRSAVANCLACVSSSAPAWLVPAGSMTALEMVAAASAGAAPCCTVRQPGCTGAGIPERRRVALRPSSGEDRKAMRMALPAPNGLTAKKIP